MKNSQAAPSKSHNGTGFLVASHASVTWNSPLPPSGELQKLKEVMPDAPERILFMAEREQNARIAAKEKELQLEEEAAKTERHLIDANQSNIRLCSLLAFLSVCLVLLVTTFGFMKGQGIGGGILGASGLCAIVWAFRRESHITRTELSTEKKCKDSHEKP